MNFDDTPQEAKFRQEARTWINANAPTDFKDELAAGSEGVLPAMEQQFVAIARKWQKDKAAQRWSCLQWPREYGGRGATPIERVIFSEEEGVYGQLNQPFIIGQGMVGPVLMSLGTEAQKQSMIAPIASGEHIWCQLFSEPAGGSDLAGLRTRAERASDGWVINGQKIWNSYAHFADYGILIARSDPTVPKHRGLTAFYLSMKSPGLEVRPIKQASGHSEFNETYFTDVRVPDSQRIGNVGDGWNVALATLMNERFAIGGNVATGFPEIFAFCCQHRTDDGLAIDDPAVRSKLASWAVRNSGLKYTTYRSISALSRGERPGPENSIGKLVAGWMSQEIASFALDLQGAHGLFCDTDYVEASGHFQARLLRAPATRLAGGTDEIMRNIIAERVLGLPGDIRVDKDVPFNKIAANGR